MYIIINENRNLVHNINNSPSEFFTKEDLLVYKDSIMIDYKNYVYSNFDFFDFLENKPLIWFSFYLNSNKSNIIINIDIINSYDKLGLDRSHIKIIDYAKMLYREQLINELLE